MSLILLFYISNGTKQIRLVFKENSLLWDQVKDIVSSIVSLPVSSLEFTVNSQNLDVINDSSFSFVNNLASSLIFISCPSYFLSLQQNIFNQNGTLVSLKFLDKSQLSLRVNLDTFTCTHLKEIVDSFTGFLPCCQRIIFNGKVLEDSKLLSFYNISENSEITVFRKFFDGILPDLSKRDECFHHLPYITVFDSNENSILFSSSKPALIRSN
jgi:hypothetical protein